MQRWVRMVRWSWVSDWSVIWLPHRSPPLTTRSWNKSKCSVNLCSNLWLFLFWLRKGMVSLECYHHYPISRQFCKPLYMHWQICSYHKLFPILCWELGLYCPGSLPLYSNSPYRGKKTSWTQTHSPEQWKTRASSLQMWKQEKALSVLRYPAVELKYNNHSVEQMTPPLEFWEATMFDKCYRIFRMAA